MSYTVGSTRVINTTSSSGTTDFTFTFPYIKEDHIEVYNNYTKLNQGTGTGEYQVITNVSPKLIRLGTGTTSANVRIEIRRNSSLDSPLVDYADGSTLTANDLDTSALQSLYIDQELKDSQFQTVSISATTGLPTLGTNPLTEVANPTNAQDAATKNYVDSTVDTKIDSALTDDIAAGSSISITDNSPSSGKVTLNVIAATGSNSGSLSASDKTKLDGIDTGAKDDQTAAEIRVLVESATDSNVFTDNDHSRLNAMENNSTADQTGAEIKTAYEAESNTNAYTDAEKSKLAAIDTGAKDDQTASEIKTLLQSDKLTDSEIAAGTLDNRYFTETELTGGALDGRYYTETESDARYFNISTGDTIKDGDAFPDNDTTIATTAAINDRIIDLVDDVGGFVPIANETSFPNANPDVNNGTGTLVSIKALGSDLTSNGSGVATISNGTVGNSTVTITGLANSTTYAATFGMIVETTSTLNTYTFHRLVPKATEVSTVSGSISNVNTVAGAISNVNSVASNATNINTVAGINANVTTVAGISSNVTSVAGNSTNINAVNSNATNINTVAGAITNVNTVGGSIANVNTVATNISSVNDFAARYRVASSDPGSNNDTGDLVFNTSSNELRVYNGSAWQGGVTATGNLLAKSGDQMTGNLTFSGSQTVDGRDVSVDGTKLDGIATNANNYTHPNHSGEVTSSADGAQTIADNVVDEANLKVSNSPSNGQFLSAQSGNTGGLTWAAIPVPDADKIEEGNTSVETVDTGSDGHVKITTEGTERVRIDNSGVVRIGGNTDIFNPASDVMTLSGSGHTGLTISTNDTTAVSSIYFADGNTGNESYRGYVVYQHVHDKLLFATAATAALTIDSSQNATFAGTATATTFSGSGASLTSLNATNLGSGTVPTARLGSGTASSSNFLRGDNTWQTISATPEGTSILSTGESTIRKFLRTDSDGTCSWAEPIQNDPNANIQFGGANSNDLWTSGGAPGYNFFAGWQVGSTVTHSDNVNYNVGIGYRALKEITGTSSYNTAVGYEAGTDITTGSENSLFGYGTGARITTGGYNSCLGRDAGKSITTGGSNVAIGYQAFGSTTSTTGSNNIGIGYGSTYNLTSGAYNTSLGMDSGRNISTGTENVCLGHNAGKRIQTSSYQIAIGLSAMGGSGNALFTGTYNVGIGTEALYSLTTGRYNLAIGSSEAGRRISTGEYNIVLGYRAGDQLTTGDNNIVIGKDAAASSATVDNEITFGNTSTTKLRIPGINFTLKDNGGTPSSGKVLTADSNGEGYWADGGVAADANQNVVSFGATLGGFDLTSSSNNPQKNFFLGYQAGNSISSQTSGNDDLVTASRNIAMGYRSMYQMHYMANSNIAIGDETLRNGNTSGLYYNVAIGLNAGYALQGNSSTFVGFNAGYSVTTGSRNVAIGYQTLKGGTTTGSENIAIGYLVGKSLTSGAGNIMLGRTNTAQALTTGAGNIIIGQSSGYNLTTGEENTFIGNESAGFSTTTGSNNTCIGKQATASSATVSNEITLGNTSVDKFRVPGINFVLKDNGGTPSDGQVLTADSNGEGYWATAGGGAYTQVGTVTVGSSSSYSLNFPSSWWNTYKHLKIIYKGSYTTGGGSSGIYFRQGGISSSNSYEGSYWYGSSNGNWSTNMGQFVSNWSGSGYKFTIDCDIFSDGSQTHYFSRCFGQSYARSGVQTTWVNSNSTTFIIYQPYTSSGFRFPGTAVLYGVK